MASGSCIDGRDAILAAIARAIFFQSSPLVQLLLRKHAVARHHIGSCSGCYFLRFPAQFEADVAKARAAVLGANID
eukprot:6321602-Karenia_brevis.AAC.1